MGSACACGPARAALSWPPGAPRAASGYRPEPLRCLATRTSAPLRVSDRTPGRLHRGCPAWPTRIPPVGRRDGPPGPTRGEPDHPAAGRFRRRPAGGDGRRAQPGSPPAAPRSPGLTDAVARWSTRGGDRPCSSPVKRVAGARTGPVRGDHRCLQSCLDGGSGSMRRVGTLVARLVWRPSPLARVLIGLVLLYRLAISPMLAPRCRFEPSCSAYGLDALRRFGAVRGTVLVVWRLARCQPFCRGGFDPVPQRGRWGLPTWSQARRTAPAETPPRSPGATPLEYEGRKGAVRC